MELGKLNSSARKAADTLTLVRYVDSVEVERRDCRSLEHGKGLADTVVVAEKASKGGLSFRILSESGETLAETTGMRWRLRWRSVGKGRA